MDRDVSLREIDWDFMNESLYDMEDDESTWSDDDDSEDWDDDGDKEEW